MRPSRDTACFLEDRGRRSGHGLATLDYESGESAGLSVFRGRAGAPFPFGQHGTFEPAAQHLLPAGFVAQVALADLDLDGRDEAAFALDRDGAGWVGVIPDLR